MKLLHTADLHLGQMLGSRSLLDVQKDALEQICLLAATLQVEGVLITGNLLAQGLAGHDLLQAVQVRDGFLAALSAHCAVYLAGDNDRTVPRMENVHVACDITAKLRPIETKSAQIWLLPTAAPELVQQRHPAEMICTTSDAMQALVGEMHRNPAQANIVLAQGAMDDDCEDDAIALLGGMIAPAVFADCDLVALGGLQQAQRWGNVHYAGTPVTAEGRVQSVQVYEISARNVTATAMPLAGKHQVKRLVGTYAQILQAAQQMDKATTLVHVQITDRPCTPAIRQMLAHMFPLLTGAVGQVPHAVYAQSDGTAQIFADFCAQAGVADMTAEMSHFLTDLQQNCR